MDNAQIVELLLIGFAAGLLGGMLGIGGSILMIPAMAIVLGPNQHLYQAAAMIVNIFVAVPASLEHYRAGAVHWRAFRRMLPFGILLIVIGVTVSDEFEGETLQRLFGVFLLYVAATNVLKIVNRTREPHEHEQRTGWAACGFVGAVMGFMAGLLGIGGGGIAVPLLQRVCNLPLRNCIATSSTVMCLTAIVGAIRKNATLAEHFDQSQLPAQAPLELHQSLIIAACTAPTAIIGGLLGAALTHRIGLTWVRLAFVGLMVLAGIRMLGLI